MLISFDSKTFVHSKISEFEKNSLVTNLLRDKYSFFNKGTSGPKNFVSNLILAIEKNNLAKTTFNFINSDIHLLNSGSFSPLWGKQFQPKRKDRVIVRLDGVGVDSEGINFEKTKNTFLNILNKGSFYIYQSQFAKNCFSNIYHTNHKGRVILNGAPDYNFEKKMANAVLKKINLHYKKNFYTLAGRFINRKRILEIINQFTNYDLGNLVVLSDVPEKMKVKNKRITYLGMTNPEIARFIISKSLALIHFDRYDWCPNIVIAALKDSVPVVCSNYGGTPEIVGKNGLIVNEFPQDLPHDLEGINFTKKSKFPGKIFRECITDNLWKRNVKIHKNSFDLNKTAKDYVITASKLIK